MEKEIEMEREAVVIGAGGAVNSVNGQTGDVVLTTSDLENTSDYQTGTEVESAIRTAIAGIDIPTKTSDLTNDGATGTSTYVEATALAAETTARENADNGLQGQIDALSAASDVTDIVGTKAELNAYDTSKLKNNDIIKVLQDESEDDETTYYRWSTTTQSFTLIGEEGPYYTKAATDILLQGKQDTLTAGTNITIDSSNVISATDTTYSDFTGTDGTTAGAAGLVPAPATTDAGKFLKADGTWDDAAGSTYTAGDGIDITNDVISTTNTGKARVLTTADYNYPTTGTPTSVALWLLSPGVYTTNGNVTLRKDTGSTVEGLINTVVIGEAVSNYYPVIAIGPNRTSAGIKMQYIVANISGSSSISTKILTSDDIYFGLDSTSGVSALAASQGKVLKDLVDSLAIRGAGAPTTATVGQVGTLYEDTTNGDLYICTDATNPYVWEEVGGGGGPTVVQTTGTSTTDVMSQNAVTSMIFADPATQYKIKIGAGTSASEGNDSVEIGRNAKATGINSTALGVSASATGNRSTAIGQASNAEPVSSLAVGGAGVRAGSNYGVAIGHAAEVSFNKPGAIALGAYSFPSATGEMNIGSSNTSYGYNSSNYRLLTGLYDPQSAHDAATKGYVDPTTDSSAPTSATVGRLGQIFIDTTNADAYMCVAVDTVTPSYTWRKITP